MTNLTPKKDFEEKSSDKNPEDKKEKKPVMSQEEMNRIRASIINERKIQSNHSKHNLG